MFMASFPGPIDSRRGGPRTRFLCPHYVRDPANERGTCASRLCRAPRPCVVPGVISSIQTHGTLANWHPHLHVLATDGAFRPDGTFVPLGTHALAVLTEAFRRAVLRAFVQHGLFNDEVAASMLAWPHSGFHVHNAVRLDGEDLRGTLQLARYAARAPVALARITYDATKQQVLLASDKSEGPTAGTHAFAPLDFLAQLLTHIPRQGEHLGRYYGAYASRTRGTWRRQGIGPGVERQRGEGDQEDGSGGPAPDPHGGPDNHSHAPPPDPLSPSRAALRKRWAELLRRIYEVDPLSCPRCGGEMRIIAFLLDPPVIDAILRHLRRASYDARAGPWADVVGGKAAAGDAGPAGRG